MADTADLDYVHVVQRLGAVVGDSPDDVDSDPDFVPVTEGTITIVPTSPESKVMVNGAPVSVMAAPIVCTVDAQGYLSYGGTRGVWVVDMGSDKVTPPVPRDKAAFTVTYANLKFGGQTFKKQPVNINPDSVKLAGADFNITEATNLPLPAGVTLAYMQGLADEAVAARDDLLAQKGAKGGIAALDATTGAVLDASGTPAIPASQKDQPGGVPSLGPDSKMSVVQVPDLSATYVKHISPASFAAGGTDVAVEIAAAFATGAPEVRIAGLMESYYPVASTVVVPAGKRLIMPPGTYFRATADVDMFEVKEGATLDGALLDPRSVATYSHAALVLHGTKTFGSNATATSVRNVRLWGSAGDAGRGTGLLLDAGAVAGSQISFAQFDNLKIQGFDTSIVLNADQPATGMSWVNGNTFRGIVISQPKRAIDLRASKYGPFVNGNQFLGIVVQCYTSMESVLLCDGGLNHFDLSIFDWPYPTTPSITLTSKSGSNTIITAEPGFRVSDHGYGNTVHSSAAGSTGKAVTRILGGPAGESSPGRYGTQDDWLAFAADRGDAAVAQTTGTALTSGSLSDMFHPDAAKFATWTDSGEHVVQATWVPGIRGQVYGVIFGYAPDAVKCEVQKGGSWVTILDVTENYSGALEVSPGSPNDFGITGVRWTFTGFSQGQAAAKITVERLWMFEQRAPGMAYAMRHSPTITGSLGHAGDKAGFYGVAPVGRQSLPAAGTVTADDIRALLVNLGLAQ